MTAALIFGSLYVLMGAALLLVTRRMPKEKPGFAPWTPRWVPRTAAGRPIYPLRLVGVSWLVLGIMWITGKLIGL